MSTIKLQFSVVILNWQAAEDTIACVQQIQQWPTLRPTVYIVDNASADGSVAQIRAACPDVVLIENEINLGFAGGTNCGLRQSLIAGDEVILLLNNDATMGEADVRMLLETLRQEPQARFVTPVLYDADQRFISAGGKNPVRHFQTRVTDLPDEVAEVECVSGTAVVIKSELLQKIGLLDERYFFSTELADLCFRARRAGYRCLVDGRARATHNVERSSPLRSTLYTYYIIRNRFIFLRTFYTFLPKIGLWLFWASYSVVLAGKLWLAGERGSARAVWLGVMDGCRGQLGGQNQRVLDFVRGGTS